MNVCVIGLGYVGLTLAVYLAQKGMNVQGVDVSDKVLDSLGSGKAHFFETDFDEQLALSIDNGKFTFGREIEPAQGPVAYIVTVGTPLYNDKSSVNLEPLKAVCTELKRQLKDNDLVVLRSTVRVGVTRNVVKTELDKAAVSYHLAFCPERTLEGCAFEELASLPQIVSGIDDKSLKAVTEFFEPVSSEVVGLNSVEEAEMVKLLNNSERDLMFALANEVALMCDSKGLNAYRIIDAANYKYPRSNIKKPGPVGGPCLEKDPYILTEGFLGGDYVPRLFLQGRAVNEDIVERSLERVLSETERSFMGRGRVIKIAILGFAFKGVPPTGDMRGSLVYSVINLINKKFPNVEIVGHDYLAEADEMREAGVAVSSSIEDAVSQAELVIFQNNHPKYCKEDWNVICKGMSPGAVLFDFWNQLADIALPSHVAYAGLGSIEAYESAMSEEFIGYYRQEQSADCVI